MMTKLDYDSGNKKLGLFMGYQVNKYGFTISREWKDSHGCNHFSEATRKNFDCHSDWNLLIKVVEKIESIHTDHHGYFGVHIISNTCTIQGTKLWMAIKDLSGYGAVYCSDTNAVFNTKIDSTWYACVSFVEWYNINCNSFVTTK